MSDQYIGEIRSFGFNFAPSGWFQCNGQTLSIQAYTPLFAIIGTFYGGNGTTTFQLPNLQGSVPMHWGQSTTGSTYVIGQTLGSTNVTLTGGQVPAHTHLVQVAASTGSRSSTPTSAAWLGDADPGKCYIEAGPPNTSLSPAAIGQNTGGLPHENMQPYLTINFCIAYSGTFPPRG